MAPSQDHSKKVVFITGASTGIGKCLAQEFYRHGHSVIIFARRQDLLENLAKELTQSNSPGKVLVIPGDVTSREQVHEAVQKTVKEFGRIDILINNAGKGLNSFFEDMNPEAVQKVFDLNIMGVIHCSQEVIPIMENQKSGQIVNITSIAGKRGLPSRGAYCASKFAVEGFSETMRLELKLYGIEICVIRPTSTDTDFFTAEPMGPSFLEQTGRKRMSAEKVARLSYQGIMKHKRTVTISLHGKLAVLLNTLTPKFVDWILFRVYKKMKSRRNN